MSTTISEPTMMESVPDLPPEGAPTSPPPRTSHVVLRRVDPWSVLKLSLVFYFCVCLVLLVASVVLWAGASASGVVGNVEGFFRDAGFDGFEFAPAQLLKAFAIGGLILVLAGTLANMLLAALFNLMSDVVGGLKVTLAEDVRRRRGR